MITIIWGELFQSNEDGDILQIALLGDTHETKPVMYFKLLYVVTM